MELNNNEIAVIIGKAVGEAVAPLYDKINSLQEAINKPQQVEQPKQEDKEPEQFDWDKTVKRLRESGKIKW